MRALAMAITSTTSRPSNQRWNSPSAMHNQATTYRTLSIVTILGRLKHEHNQYRDPWSLLARVCVDRRATRTEQHAARTWSPSGLRNHSSGGVSEDTTSNRGLRHSHNKRDQQRLGRQHEKDKLSCALLDLHW